MTASAPGSAGHFLASAIADGSAGIKELDALIKQHQVLLSQLEEEAEAYAFTTAARREKVDRTRQAFHEAIQQLAAVTKWREQCEADREQTERAIAIFDPRDAEPQPTRTAIPNALSHDEFQSERDVVLQHLATMLANVKTRLSQADEEIARCGSKSEAAKQEVDHVVELLERAERRGSGAATAARLEEVKNTIRDLSRQQDLYQRGIEAAKAQGNSRELLRKLAIAQELEGQRKGAT
jgi:chromosome segregation ATPase